MLTPSTFTTTIHGAETVNKIQPKNIQISTGCPKKNWSLGI